jgi:lysyl-tRNA synthetase class 1
MDWVAGIVKQALKRKRDGGVYVVSDWKTPSGRIHIGALRGVLIHNSVYEELIKRGKKAQFFYGFDDYDPMDKIPIGLPSLYKKYLGMPFSEIPSPLGKGSYGGSFAKEFIDVFDKLDIRPKILYSSKLYKDGKFNCAFDIVIREAEKIRQLYKIISRQSQPKDWLPVQMICRKCGKVATTRAYNYKGGRIYYKCERNYVKYAQGCGYQGVDSPHDGNAKLPWKVEWAAKWFILGSDIEGAGKDHQTKGGSHDLASAILREVFKCQVPVNIFYEWFLVKDKSMSSSKGVGMPASEITEVLPPELIRYLILRTKPRAQINFDLGGDAIPNFYNDFDQKMTVRQATKKWLFKFSKVAFLIQMPHVDIKKQAEKDKGKALTIAEKKELAERKRYARIWLKRYADKKYIFELQSKMPKVGLTSQQRQFLAELSDVYQTKKNWRGDDLHAEIHKIKDRLKIKPKSAFEAIYQIFLARPDGPQAGWFLASLDRGFIEKRLKQAVKMR